MKKLMILFSGIIMIAGTGCKKGFLDVNTNPNTATNTTPELVLPNALAVTAARQITGYTFVSGWMGYWAISGSYALNTNDFTTYKQTTDFGDGLWRNLYDNLEDYNYIEQAATSADDPTKAKPFYIAAAKIMKAYEYQQLVDMFNNVPYTNALQGTGQILPTYDDAQAVYDSIVANIDIAVGLMAQPEAQASATSDILFGGDTQLWIQFANTLKLRILMRQSQIGRDDYIKSEIGKISGGYLEQDAAVNPGYVQTDGKMNPFYDFCFNATGTYTQDFWRANQYYIQFDIDNHDPRYMYVYGPTPSNDTVYAGNYLGQSNNALVGSASSIFGPGVLKSFDQSAVVLSASESYFLQAEAVIRGWITGDAGALYHNGVTSSFEYLGVPDADAAAQAYTSQVGNPRVYWSDAQSFSYKLSLIIRQKWAAMNTVTPFEAWADYRRLHLPSDVPISQSPYVDVPAIPYRILYPTVEYTTNAENVAAEGTVDQHTDKIFWMP